MKLVAMKLINGVETLIVAVTATGNQGSYVKIIAGVGEPFYLWPSIPTGQVIACDFTNAPIVSADVTVNNAAIAAMNNPDDPAYTQPLDVLTYAP